MLPLRATAASHPAEDLYLQLGRVGLDPQRVYKVREASLERSAIHISLEDGTIAFTKDVMGRVTGAFFEGDGEILLVPPNEVERKSMSLFTGMAILEERFATAYFRFNDDTMAELRPDLRATDNAQEFVKRWDESAKNLAHSDAMRLLVSLSRNLPGAGSSSPLYPARMRGTECCTRGCKGQSWGYSMSFLIRRPRNRSRSGKNGPPKMERPIMTCGLHSRRLREDKQLRPWTDKVSGV